MTSSNPTALPIPARSPSLTAMVAATPIWALEDPPVLLQSCAKGEREICCKTLKGSDERQLIDPDVLRDLVIGLADGLTVPFALTAGLAVLGSTKLVVTGGLAELISGSMSMGIGGFLAAQAERHQFLFLVEQTRERVERSCVGEMEREVHAVLAPTGIEAKVSAVVAASLFRAEREAKSERPRLQRNVFGKGYLRGRIGGEPGLTQFLLRYGEGMEETTRLRMLVSGATVGAGYMLGGIVPMIPYFIVKNSVLVALWWSIGVTGIALLLFGSLKAYYTGAGKGVLGVVYGALSTLAIGGAAAAASYGVVKALE